MAISANATAFGNQPPLPIVIQPQAGAQEPVPQNPGVEVFAVPDYGISSATEKKALARIALLLPLKSDTLAQAAQAVRAGFMVAAERDVNSALSVDIIDSGESSEEILAAYGMAVQAHDIVVGPLSRSGTSAIAYSGAVSKPTIALGQVDIQEENKTILPAKMLAIGLSVEDEARQIATMAHGNRTKGKVLVVSASAAWQRRAAKAFAEQWQRLGHEFELIEMDIAASGTYLGPNGLVELKKRIQSEKPAFIFAALDALQTRQMRLYVGNNVAVYGTSQVNSSDLIGQVNVQAMPEMNGVRLVDIPWLVQPDDPAVMAYPKPDYPADQSRNTVLERLYALGIDAYRIAAELALNQAQIRVDGVTGKLSASLNKGSSRFERIEVPAVYRDGKVLPAGGMQ
jgi:outer membrane PBP1 activator LpoA protein